MDLQRRIQPVGWFENIGVYVGQEPTQFCFNLLTRSRRLTYDNLRTRRRRPVPRKVRADPAETRWLTARPAASPALSLRHDRAMTTSPMSGAPILVLLADDQEMVRSGFRFFLDAQPDITVVAEAADAEPLTDHELDVVRLVALGRTNAEIYVSLSTVKTHLSSVQLKLAARNRVEIAAWAWQHGYARPRP
ncbi:LuxR C-terminal-related transcriptional regulator [Streptomyces coeruleorubidus]|jgi:DNA-binding CsgD family transcriptional regulator